MAFNFQGYGQGFNPNYYPTFYQPQMQIQPQQQQQPQPQQMQPQQIQNSGFISVPSEDIVNTYPVAPGNCVTFKIEGQPIVMEKSMGFSQLESPKVERYRLVKEQPILPQTETKTEEPINLPQKDFQAEIDEIWAEIEAIKKDMVKPTVQSKKKKEVVEDDADA